MHLGYPLAICNNLPIVHNDPPAVRNDLLAVRNYPPAVCNDPPAVHNDLQGHIAGKCLTMDYEYPIMTTLSQVCLLKVQKRCILFVYFCLLFCSHGVGF